MKDLYSLSLFHRDLVDEASGLPPAIVTDIVEDVDGYFHTIPRNLGILDQPQIVGAIGVTLQPSYLYALVSEQPELGASLLYGAILTRPSYAQDKAFDMASSAFESDIDLPVETLDFVEHACQAAARLRARTTEDPLEKRVLNLLDRLKIDIENAIDGDRYQRPTNHNTQHPTFDRFHEMFDQLREAVVEGKRVNDAFFQSREPSTENYVRAIFGSKLKHDCPVRQQAREYLNTLDPALSKWLYPEE